MSPESLTSALDTGTEVTRSDVRRLEVLGHMRGRRWLWSVDQKLAILAEADRSDNIAALARRLDVPTRGVVSCVMPGKLWRGRCRQTPSQH